jgi:uncharacterized protein (DUF433 family)
LETIDLPPGERPLYTLDQAARYIGLPKKTLRNWVRGYGYADEEGEKAYPLPLIQASSPLLLLSFNNLVEVNSLFALSRWGSETAIYRAIEEAKTSFGVERPLLMSFETGLGEFFAERLSLTRSERLAFREALTAHSMCAERNEEGTPIRFWPRVGGKTRADWVNLNPRVLFGVPTVMGVETRILAWRYDAGEEPEELAEDYGLPLDAVLEAVVFEGLRMRSFPD